MPPLGCWLRPIRGGVLHRDFHVRGTAAGAVPEQALDVASPPTFFKPDRRQSAHFRDLVGTRNPDHPTFSAESSRQLVEDLELTRYLFRRDALELGPECWRTILLRRGLVVRNTTSSSDQFFFSMGCHTRCAMLWPATRNVLEGGILFSPATLTSVMQLEWSPVVRCSDWVVMETKVISPCHWWVKCGKKLPKRWPAMLHWQTSSEPETLLEVAAKNAFWDLGMQFIDKLLSHEFPLDG